MQPPRTIHIAAALITRTDGKVLLVRKRGTTAFMQPGGKLEPGESPEAALRRELAEELALTLCDAPAPLGSFSAPAANEPGATVVAEVFAATISSTPAPQAEIAEIRWIDPCRPIDIELAPLTRDHILPAHRRRTASEPRS